jgi:hypothetical protein
MMDLMALINSGINFLLYCSMSSKFRSAFQDTFFRFLPIVRRDQAKPSGSAQPGRQPSSTLNGTRNPLPATVSTSNGLTVTRSCQSINCLTSPLSKSKCTSQQIDVDPTEKLSKH